jgi:enoyl-CoA hydratase
MSVRTAFEQRGAGMVARVTIDNPRKLNILSRAALAHLVATMKDVAAADGLRAVVLTGAGTGHQGAHLDDPAP